MRTLFCRLIAPLFSLVAALSCSAAQDEGLPLAPTRELHFSTAEGICIWMSVDVVPDGKARRGSCRDSSQHGRSLPRQPPS